MNIDLSNFFEIKADRRTPEKTVTINESGRIKISKAIVQSLEKATLAIYVANDYGELLLDQNGEELKFKADGSIQIKKAMEHFNHCRAVYPLIYDMDWNDEQNVWTGQLRLPTPSPKRRKKKAALEELV